MEDRKLRRYNKEPKTKKEGKKINKLNIVSRTLMIALVLILIAIFAVVIYLKVLPNKYLIPLGILLIVVMIMGIFLLFRKKTSNKLKIMISVFSSVLIVVFSFVGLKLIKTLNFLGEMTTETVNAKTYSVVVLKDSKYTKMEDLQYRLLLYYDNELDKNKEAIDKLNSVITLVTEKTNDVNELANKLLKGKVDAILIEDSYYAIIEEEIKDFKDKTKVIYTFALEDVIATIAKDVSVTKEPFNIYISGIDSYGKISSVARSDVNMIVSVNPQTKQILLVNTPRDYYVQLHGTSGYRDKLTHAGIYGIDMSVKTMEDLYDIDINYYVRVNFTSLIDIINAIGGVNVYSEYEFTSRIGGYHFKKGYNQMNGKQALGFARERYSFNEGDRMRGQNQQAVINAMIKKVCSSSTILTKFDALLDSLKGSFQTNMEYTKIIEIVRMQISDGSEWKISSISVDGSGSMERTYSMGKTLLSVLIPYAGSVNQAEAMIKDVLAGNMLEEGNIDISGYNDYLVVSRGVYEKEEPEEEETEEVIPEEVPDDNEEQENTDNSTENEEGNEENTENNNGGTGNDSTNTEDPETGDSTNSGTEIEDNKENSGNTGDSNETENNDNTSTDNGNSGTDTENENNTGNSSETDNGSTSNENPSESVSPVPQ